MKGEQAKEPTTTIEPILREIDGLNRRIREADVGPDDEYRRTQALMLLDSVAQVLKAFCLAPSQSKSYYYYTFGTKDKARGR